MSQHEIKSRTSRLIATACALALIVLIANGPSRDATDDAAARAHEGREVVAK